MQTMPGSLQWILQDHRQARAGSSRAVAGAAAPGTAGRRIAYRCNSRGAPFPPAGRPLTLGTFILLPVEVLGGVPRLRRGATAFQPEPQGQGTEPRGPGAEPLVAVSLERWLLLEGAHNAKPDIRGAIGGACAARAALRAVWTDCQEPPRTTLSAALCPTSNAPSGFGLVGDAV